MSERTFLFLLSLAVFVGAIGVAAWLMVTNQVGTVDGLFLFCSSLVAAFAFGLYLRWSEDNQCRGDLCFVKRVMIC
jgi:hypothetical protein